MKSGTPNSKAIICSACIKERVCSLWSLSFIKIALVIFSAYLALQLVSSFPIAYVYWPTRGISGSGIFPFISQGTFYGLFFYSILFCSLSSYVLKLPKLVIPFLTISLTAFNLSILIIDVRRFDYTPLIEKTILENYGSIDRIYSFAYSASFVGCVLFIVSVLLLGRYSRPKNESIASGSDVISTPPF